MQALEHYDDGDDGTVFRDVIMLALLGFVTIVVLLLPHLNPAPDRPRAGVDRRLVPESLPAGKGTHMTRQVDPPLPHKHLQSQVDRILSSC